MLRAELVAHRDPCTPPPLAAASGLDGPSGVVTQALWVPVDTLSAVSVPAPTGTILIQFPVVLISRLAPQLSGAVVEVVTSVYPKSGSAVVDIVDVVLRDPATGEEIPVAVPLPPLSRGFPTHVCLFLSCVPVLELSKHSSA